MAAALGALVRTVMEIARRRGEVGMRDLSREFGKRVAYATLMTTLNRLSLGKLSSASLTDMRSRIRVGGSCRLAALATAFLRSRGRHHWSSPAARAMTGTPQGRAIAPAGLAGV